MLWLQVRSRTLESIKWIPGPLAPSDERSPPAVDSRRVRRRVQFVCPTGAIEEGEPHSSATKPQALPSPESSFSPPNFSKVEAYGVTKDLSRCDHICTELEHQAIRVPVTAENCSALGHVDCCQDFRHQFYPPLIDGAISPCIRGTVSSGEVVSLDDILGQSIEDRLTVPQQLKLAHRIASAVLKFSSTPWLDQNWSARDLNLFSETQSRDPARSLQTLHFGVDFQAAASHQLSSSAGAMELDVDQKHMNRLVEDAARRHGIRNITLYNLGVILLTIGRWARVDPGNVEEVRRIAEEPCPLGARNKQLTSKILDCDFGLGKDLTKPRLQEAFYDDVLLELESMVELLDLEDG